MRGPHKRDAKRERQQCTSWTVAQYISKGMDAVGQGSNLSSCGEAEKDRKPQKNNPAKIQRRESFSIPMR